MEQILPKISSLTPSEIFLFAQRAIYLPSSSEFTLLPFILLQYLSPNPGFANKWDYTRLLFEQPQLPTESHINRDITNPNNDPKIDFIRDTFKFWRNGNQRTNFRQFIHVWVIIPDMH